MNTKTYQHLFLATRPKTWFAGLSPIILALAVIFDAGADFSFLFLSPLLATWLAQISSNLINDAHDSESGVDQFRDAMAPQRMSVGGHMTFTQMKFFYRITLALSFLCGLPAIIHGGIPIFILGVFSLLMAYLYTAGPFPLAYYACGEFLAFLFFGPVAVCGTHYALTPQHFNMAASLPFGLYAGLMSALIMHINNARDRESDQKSGKKTLAQFYPSFMTGPILLAVLFLAQYFWFDLYSWALLAVIPLAFLFSLMIFTRDLKKYYPVALPLTGLTLFIQSVIFLCSILL
jgi:1,4-dihydroxy-2-naphthoate polyprenyltransferase